ncbi:hypothetical protein [Sulfurihydrogenibium sp.]|jgi:ribosomal protein S20|uniref:hypothetical protein n=1 Tax=Sulfurihydrogenibium sp. TaxID=2053621 RepID=UPI002624FCC7|nr:hypothetical protein [Sulfurihydrogenibium sp.]
MSLMRDEVSKEFSQVRSEVSQIKDLIKNFESKIGSNEDVLLQKRLNIIMLDKLESIASEIKEIREKVDKQNEAGIVK